MKRLLAWLSRFGRDARGAAAIEFAGIGSLLMVGTMNAIDVGRYAYESGEVATAAQAGAQAAYVACDLDHTPATINCSGLNAAVASALQTTRLGDDVKLDGALVEGYYCLDAQNALKKVSDAGSKPSNCSAVNTSAAPTLYLQVNVTYTFTPLFPQLTLANGFSPTMKRSAMMRMA